MLADVGVMVLWADSGTVPVVAHVLATLAVVMAAGLALGQVLRRFGQPAVIGEVMAGILLGPSLLGAVWPEAMHALIPTAAADPQGQVRTALNAIAQLGVVLYMFLVGLELDLAHLQRRAGVVAAASAGSLLAPMAAGAALAVGLHPYLAADVPLLSFCLFVGVAMAITAFPVLARILADQHAEKTELGVIALGAAAVGDVAAWCLLAVAVGVVQANLENGLFVVVGAVAYLAAVLLAVRPAVAWLARRWDRGPLPALAFPLTMVAVFLSALATEKLGIHAVFGAFALGAAIPHDTRIAAETRRRLHDTTLVLLLPAFFAVTGMNTQVGLIDGWGNWAAFAAVMAVAVAGKFAGVYLAVRLCGMDSRPAAALGWLMNARGLMELIVAGIGLSLGVFSPTFYAMLVLMALLTTLTAAPALAWLARAGRPRDAGAEPPHLPLAVAEIAPPAQPPSSPPVLA